MNSPSNITRALRSTMMRALAFVSALIIAFAGLLVPEAPFVPTPTADAQTPPSKTNFGDCNFRKGTGEAAALANSLCFFDWSGFELTKTTNTATPASKVVTKKVGRYTVTFTMTLKSDRDNAFPSITGKSQPSFQPEKAVFNSTRSGTDYFTGYSGNPTNVLLDYVNSGRFNERNVRIGLENISVTDEKGNAVSGYSFALMDGASTFAGSVGEAISMENRGTGTVERLQRFTPPDFIDACTFENGIYGPGTEATRWYNDANQRDFLCQPSGLGNTTIGSTLPGTFAVSATNPKNLDVSLFTASTGYQSIALALSVGRIAGSLNPVDTSFEQQATGQATSFDFKAYDRIGSTDTQIPLTANQYTTQLRTNGTDGKPVDSYVFKSTASGAQANLATQRYTPSWTCTVGENTTYTIREGSVPSGFTLNNTASGSELVYPNKDNLPVSCTATWTPKYQTSTLQLAKKVDGTASTYDDVALRKFRLVYTCTDYNGFAAAYPSVNLTGFATLSNGETKNVTNLPRGMQCSVKEEFPDNNPPAGSGVDHDLNWSSGTQSGEDLPTTNLTLGTSNALRADNTYDKRTGTLILSKELVGDPVGEFSQTREYKFEISCTGTDFNGVQTTMTITRNGTVANGQVTINDVPVGRDCTVLPLTGLSAADSQKYKFDGRDVTFQGQPIQVNAQGAYPFKLADYPDGGTPTSGEMHIIAKYSYQTRNVSILKELKGPAAANPELQGKEFTYNYRCTWGGDNPQEKTGTVQTTVSTNQDIATIQDIPVGAQCTIYEEDPASYTNVVFDRAELTHANAADDITTLSNDDARNQPILTVNTSTDPAQNRVVVSNYYNPRLGTVDFTKVVDTSGIGTNLPDSFNFAFSCGSRTIVLSDGTTRAVPLDGTFSISGGTTTTLSLNSANAENNAAVNDVNGSMGVPYGNECTFTESTPDAGSYPGVVWTSDVADANLTVNADSNAATVTNTFEPLGEGLTISQSTTGGANLAEPVEYTLTCTDPQGKPVNLGADTTFTLSNADQTHTIPASTLPEGSQCSLDETNPDDGQRTRDGGGTFPIDRDSTLSYVQDSTSSPVNSTFENLAPVTSTNFTIGDATSISIGHAYSYIQTPVTAQKAVEFDPATQQYISDERKDIKRNRVFNVTLVCTSPIGGNTFSAQGQVSSMTGEISFGDVPAGSECTVTELSTTTADGINVRQEVSVNGAANSIRTQDFDAQEAGNSVQFTNTYARRLADVELNKIANLPGSIQQQYDLANQEIPYYTHTFVLECHDPETGDGAAGALMGQFTSTITGPGSTVFTDIPVGADCNIVGDQFGELNLSVTDADGTDLHAQLSPKEVRWVVDSNDGDSFTDTEVPNGTTTSQYFVVRDDNPNDNEGGDNFANSVDLVNTYEYVNTKITMTKDVIGQSGDLMLLPEDRTFNFTMQCKGVGYQYSTIGSGDNTLDPSLQLNQFGEMTAGDNGDSVRSYQGPEATVPVGSWCTFTENPVDGVPPELTHTVDEQSIEKRASETEDGPVESWDFVNRFERRTTPVTVPIILGGYTSVVNPDGYTVSFTCDDPANSTVTKTVTMADALNGLSVNTAQSPGQSFVVDLPVGANCTMDMNGSPALEANPSLEVTAGDRRPFSQFNHWLRGEAQNQDVTRPLSEFTADEVSGDMKSYTYSFDVPSDLSSTQSEMAVGAASYYMVDRVDVAFTKTTEGAVGADADYAFISTCAESTDSFNLTDGGTQTLLSVPINTSCNVSETSDGIDTVNSVLDVASSGELLTDVTVDNAPNDAEDPLAETSRSITFTVLPTTDSGDTSNSGDAWSMEAVNRFPSVDVEKTIDGAPIGSVTEGLYDTAVLPDDATSMHMTYTITNNGGMDLSAFNITDESLAGRSITNGSGETIVVGADGVIPADFCGITDLQLQAGGVHECAFDVEITEPKDQYFSYKGTVTVSATAEEGQVSDSDEFGAVRLQQAAGWMLPDTGMQTLLLFILLGLLAIAYGVYRYLRSKDEDEEWDESEDEDGLDEDNPDQDFPEDEN
ncbi:DUF5979 domain-containing protein [Corynebacterium dentalis]|uniref:DUF5979 domain-containing protein n=1 Tax=Corynebacterium dentalis TaxID=2014528 RepID=UPI00289836CA|nr:DUF5979 domain-containing protein [Corynebacterium dentalis]